MAKTDNVRELMIDFFNKFGELDCDEINCDKCLLGKVKLINGQDVCDILIDLRLEFLKEENKNG